MDHGDAEQRPAALGLLDVARDLGLRHAGIMLERQRGDGSPFSSPRQMPVKVDDRADVGAPARELRRLGAGVEVLALQADGGGHRPLGLTRRCGKPGD